MKLLLADDDFTSRQMLQAILAKQGFEVTSVCDGHEAWQALNEPDSPRIVILDWIMPGMDGIDLVRKLRERDQTDPPYVIMLTSRDRKKDLAEALNAGADDYVAKPYDIGELLARIGVGLRVTGLQASLSERLRELRRANETIALLACTDELTQLANRRSFNERLTREISAARRHNHSVALVMADLDRFKNINDTFGHDAGDRVIELFGQLLMGAVRTEDLPARWGGEEFVILLSHADVDGAAKVAERVRTALEQARCPGVTLPLTASFGVAALAVGESGDSLVRRADSALRQAKLEGRNRVVIASDEGGFIPAETPVERIAAGNSLVLVVDDDPVTVMMLEGILRNAGFETASGSDGGEAISKSLSLHPDLLLLDVQLPDMDGFSVCRTLRTDPRTAETPILFISANDDTVVKARGLEAGGVDYITKPLAGAEVIARVKTHLRLKHAYDTLARLQSERVERLAASQQMILPTPNLLPEARFAVSLKQFHGAGGDFYDVIPVGDRLVDYIVADASGHDLETSLWTTAMKTLLHEHARSIFEPSEILKTINRSLCRVMPTGLFFTVLYARLNRQSGRLTVVNGGHPPAICVPRSDSFQVIEQTGDVLGAFADATFGATEALLRPGDRFFLYTDGLVENGGDRDIGIASLGALCERHRGLSLEELVETATEEMLVRVQVSDDVVLLGVEI